MGCGVLLGDLEREVHLEMKHITPAKIAVIGDGAWGTTLAILLSHNGHHVTLWGAFPDYVDQIRKSRINKKFLPGIRIPEPVVVTAGLKDAVEANDVIVLAVPSQFLATTLKKIRRCDIAGRSFVSVVKGIELKTFNTMSQLIVEELGDVDVAVLSGPTIAIEVARNIPTTAVAASRNPRLAAHVQALFSSPTFRIYTNNDILGVELCGSVKNVIALACGICDGLGYGTNTKAAILTRGLVEMMRLGKKMGADPATFTGLAGLGDLATTCFSPNSRNRSAGAEIGRGRAVKDVLASMDAVVEGVVTSKSVHRLAQKLGIEMPITTAVYQVLYARKDPLKAVAGLMARSLKSE